ncbi:hypothetical protein HG1285_15466 [Hydrogenivirga sp. 128-5-R1-1]|nr:hypothetical protein HG1285_15466 [Hydrogenivirga sp. 128-5-R1-1]
MQISYTGVKMGSVNLAQSGGIEKRVPKAYKCVERVFWWSFGSMIKAKLGKLDY